MYQANYLAHALAARAASHPDAVLVQPLDDRPAISHSGFFARAEQMAAALVAAGLLPGDRVAVQAPKTLTMLELYVGTVIAGGVFLPLNTAYTKAEVSYFLTDASPRILVCTQGQQDGLADVAQAAGVGTILTIDAQEGGTLAEARDAQAPGFAAVPRDAEDLAAILYTSGTTGRSKGAMLSHRALASNALTLVDLWRFTPADVLIHALPIFHTHGLFVATNVVLMAGASMHFLPGFEAEQVCALMPRATSLMGVPTYYTRLLDQPGLASAARGMRLFVSGSAPLLAETHQSWRAVTGHAILERYGMTETNMNTSNPYDGERRPGTVGFALPGVDAIITDPETGLAVPQGEIGVIEVRGPNVFSGYWNMPEKTAEELRANGFFITGDLARQDADGYVHIVGRAKDLIISGGYNIYPKEIELILDEWEGVLESAVVGVPHPDLGEAVVAVIVEQKGASVDCNALLASLSDRLARFKQPRHIARLAELPRNTMGKVQKTALRDAFSRHFDPN
jgi:malonyl-CoA/methylmalonyl-CoA synthetase